MTPRGAYAGWLRSQRNPKTLGARVQAIRVAWGWTQEDLAKRLNTDRRQISLYERDKTQPSKATQALLAGFFGIPLEALVEGKDFTIPELPQSGAGVEAAKVSLPQLEGGHLVGIGLPDLDKGGLTLAQGKRLLEEVVKGGGRAWIVYEK